MAATTTRVSFQFFGGKGGVGKTTCAAARALSLARAGERVLIVSTDPAHSLGDALELALGPEPRRVPLSRAARANQGSLHAVELDADRALERWLGDRRAVLRTILERGTYLDEGDVERFLQLSLPGVDELVGLVELVRLQRVGPFPHVVVDTAPTGHTLRLLAMPGTLARIAEVLDDMQGKHRLIEGALGGAHRADAADELIAEIDEQASGLDALLGDAARVRFAWVTLPEELALAETEDALIALARAKIAVPELIVNRATPPGGAACPSCDLRRAAEAAVIDRLLRTAGERQVRILHADEVEPRGVTALLRLEGALERSAEAAAATGAVETARLPDPGEGAFELEVAARVRLLFFGGKGGVGKTTCAAAAALALARRHPDRRVLLLSTDPAHSLADALDCPLGDDERRVPGGPANLRARELDAVAALEKRRERYRDAVDELFDRLRRGSRFDAAYDRQILQDLIDLAPPGVDELFAILAVVEALDRGDQDLLVVDTAPTGHALRLLAMPADAQQWVHALMQLILKYREVAGLGQVAEDLLELAGGLRRLIALTADPGRARFVVVTRAAELERKETLRLVAALGELGVALSTVVVNALTPRRAGERCARCRRRVDAEERQLAALASGLARGLTILSTPAVWPPPRGTRALDAFGKRWQIAKAAPVAKCA